MAKAGRPRTPSEANIQSHTTAEVARLLCISERTVERLRAAGKLESYRVGRSVRIWARSVLAYQEANRLEPTGAD